MIIFYIKMKIRAGGGALGQHGGALGQQGAPPCYSSLWETLTFEGKQEFLSNFTEGKSIIKYSSLSNFEVIPKILTLSWPFFDLLG